MTTPEQLAALDKAATPGPWKKGSKRSCDIDIIGKPTWPCTRYGKKGEWDVAVVTEMKNAKEQRANANLIVALVNLYRTGQLVPVPSVEVVARALCEASGYDPDEEIVGGQATGFENYGPRWQANARSERTLGIEDYVELATAVIKAWEEGK